MTPLKPCPFCGGPADYFTSRMPLTDKLLEHVSCATKTCPGAIIAWDPAAWNTRPDKGEPVATVTWTPISSHGHQVGVTWLGAKPPHGTHLYAHPKSLVSGGKEGPIYTLRDYWSGNHRPYQNILHDADDKALSERFYPLEAAIEASGVKDGDLFRIVIVPTGRSPHAHKQWRLTKPHTYEPVAPEAAVSDAAGRIGGGASE